MNPEILLLVYAIGGGVLVFAAYMLGYASARVDAANEKVQEAVRDLKRKES